LSDKPVGRFAQEKNTPIFFNRSGLVFLFQRIEKIVDSIAISLPARAAGDEAPPTSQKMKPSAQTGLFMTLTNRPSVNPAMMLSLIFGSERMRLAG
jgi:hypothetical protein